MIPRGRRRADRANLAIEQWRGLVDDDGDANENDHHVIREEFRALIRAVQKSVENTNRILVGLLVSLSAAAVVGALNLLTTK